MNELRNIYGGESESLAKGLYELLHTKELAEQIETQPELQASFETVPDDASTDVLASYIASQARRTLASAAPADRVAVANSIPAASIMYKDYVMSPDVFHWESQNSTSPSSPVGQRYLDHKATTGTQILLFTRARENDESGMTMPYVCLGQLDYMNHTGSKPIAITWKLQRPMPAEVYTEASAVAQ